MRYRFDLHRGRAKWQHMLTEEAGAMALAIEQAAGVRSRTSPNPWVGAVLLDANGHVVGLGATEPAGGAHAEVIAITGAGARRWARRWW